MIVDLTINILCPGKSYSKLYGAESQFKNYTVQRYTRYNDVNLATHCNYTKFYLVTVILCPVGHKTSINKLFSCTGIMLQRLIDFIDCTWKN